MAKASLFVNYQLPNHPICVNSALCTQNGHLLLPQNAALSLSMHTPHDGRYRIQSRQEFHDAWIHLQKLGSVNNENIDWIILIKLCIILWFIDTKQESVSFICTFVQFQKINATPISLKEAFLRGYFSHLQEDFLPPRKVLFQVNPLTQYSAYNMHSLPATIVNFVCGLTLRQVFKFNIICEFIIPNDSKCLFFGTTQIYSKLLNQRLIIIDKIIIITTKYKEILIMCQVFHVPCEYPSHPWRSRKELNHSYHKQK